MVVLRDILWFAVLVPSFVVAGHLVLYRSLARYLKPNEYLWVATTCGLLLFTGAVFALGVIHLFTLPAVIAVIGLVWGSIFTEWTRRRHHVGYLMNTVITTHGCFRKLFRLAPRLTGMTLFIAAVAFLGCLTPEVRGDPIIYHITEAWLYVLAKGHIEIKSSALTYIPQNQQLIYALGLCLGSDSLAKLLHWLPGVLLLLGTFSLARRLGVSRRHATAAGFILATCPVWFYLATTTYIDLAVGNYLLAALFLILLSTEGFFDRWTNEASTHAVWGGVFTGAALGCKYTAGVVGYAPIALPFLWWSRRSTGSWKQAGAMVARYSFIAFLVFLPWLVRNWWWTGNPLAPSFMRYLGPWGVPESTLSWPDIQASPPFVIDTPGALIRAYFNMVLSLGDYGNFIPSLAIVLGGMGLVGGSEVRKKFFPPRVRFLIVFLILSLLLGVPTAALRRDSRYVIAHVAVLAVLAVWWFWQLTVSLPQKKLFLQRIATLSLFALLVSGGVRIWLWYRDLNETIFPIFREDKRDQYCAERLPNYLANKGLGQVLLHKEGLILGAAYPAPALYVLGGMPLSPELSIQNPKVLSVSHLPGLARYGVTHLFGDVAEELQPYLEYVGKSNGVPLWKIVRVPQDDSER